MNEYDEGEYPCENCDKVMVKGDKVYSYPSDEDKYFCSRECLMEFVDRYIEVKVL